MKRLCLVLMIGMASFVLPGEAISSSVSVAKTEIVHGTVFVVRNGEHRALGLGEAVFPLDTIVTADSGRVKLLLDDGSALFVAGNSQVGVEHYVTKYGYRISGGFNALRGRVRFVVQKVEGLDASFTVQTKSARIEVTGTDFTVVEPMGTAPTQILLRSGQIVAATVKEKGFVMKPGQLAQIISNGEVAVRKVTPKEIASMDAPFEPSTGKPVAGTSKFAGKPHSGTVGTGVKADRTNAPKVNAPKVNAPKVNAPKVNAPKVNAPKVNAPKVNTPKVNTPKVNTPKVKPPKI